MCGICGEFKFNGKSFNDVKLTNLMSSISNRGRDSKGTFKNTDIFLGHHRLSIIDTSDKSNQPMVIENYVIVFNGIIYNYKDIRQKLIAKGHIFKSTGDTEVVIRSYIEYGDKCVEHFDGVFSFCIYNLTKKNIFLARDRIGIKPLYYSINNSEIVFSSSMKGILSSKGKIEINPIALNYQFTIHSMVPAPYTIIDGIKKLEPGHTLNVTKSGKTHLHKYFDINNIELKKYSDDEIAVTGRTDNKGLFSSYITAYTNDDNNLSLIASLRPAGLLHKFRKQLENSRATLVYEILKTKPITFTLNIKTLTTIKYGKTKKSNSWHIWGSRFFSYCITS